MYIMYRKLVSTLSRCLMLILSSTDYGHTMAKYLILCGPNSNPNPNRYLGFGYRGLVFCRNNNGIMENMDKGLSTKIGANKLAENTPNAPKFICPNCLPKLKRLGF